MGSVVKRVVRAVGVIKSEGRQGIVEVIDRFLEGSNIGGQSAFRHNGGLELIPDVVRDEAELPYQNCELCLKDPFKHLF